MSPSGVNSRASKLARDHRGVLERRHHQGRTEADRRSQVGTGADTGAARTRHDIGVERGFRDRAADDRLVPDQKKAVLMRGSGMISFCASTDL
ncbi:MAG: hypothetical protein MZV64_34650 [Ignavibacteriales bacterium]|nr:hypothetical protein [Ignavibacteriales bacterium]